MAQRNLILDAGAVIALSRRDQRARAQLHAAWEHGVDVHVPAVVLAETVRGRADDAPVNMVLKAIGSYVEATAHDGRRAGHLLESARSNATIDALVVAGAERVGSAVIVTGDLSDMKQLAAEAEGVAVVGL